MVLTCEWQQQQQLKVPMRIREDSREERKAPVLVEVHIEADAQSSTPRNLMCFQVSAPRATWGLLWSRISPHPLR